MIDERPLTHKPAKPQIGFDQGRNLYHGTATIQRVRCDKIHGLKHARLGAHPQVWRRQMIVMQHRQRLGQFLNIRAVKAGDAKQNFDLAFGHIARETIPEMIHGRTAPVVPVQARPAQFQQLAATLLENAQIVFVFGIKLPQFSGAITR